MKGERHICTLARHQKCVTKVKFLRDDKLASGSIDCKVMIWSIDENKVLFEFNQHQGEITGIAYCGTGDLLLSSGLDGKTFFWDFETRETMHTIVEGTAHNCVQVTSDNTLALVGTDNSKITIENLRTKKRVISLTEHGRGVKDLCISLDDTFIMSGGNEQAIYLMGLGD